MRYYTINTVPVNTFIFVQQQNAARCKHSTKQDMTAAASNQSQGVEERDRISRLEGYWQMLQQKGRFSGLGSDYCGPSANLLDKHNNPLVPPVSMATG